MGKHNPLSPYAQYVEKTESLEKKFWEDISTLGENIRQEVIIPACQKHGVTFTSGMGRFFFTYVNTRLNRSIDFSDAIDFDRLSTIISTHKLLSLQEDLVPILKMLNTEITRSQFLGYFVDDVKKEDYCKPTVAPCGHEGCLPHACAYV